MNKEKKVTSKGLAKKIQDKAINKGFELPESEYYHLVVEDKYNTASEIVNFSRKNRSGKYNDGTKWSEKFYTAYDIAELGKMMTVHIYICESPFTRYSIDKVLKDKEIIDGEAHFNTKNIQDDNLAEAMGKMFYYLIKNDLL